MDSIALNTDIRLHQIQPGVLDMDAAIDLINRYSASNANAHLGYQPGQWFEVTEDVYWYFLEVLPPSYMSHFGFINCECVTNNLYDGFVEHKGRFFNLVTSGPGANPFSALATHLIKQVTA